MSAAFFFDKARHCRDLARIAEDPELREQLLTFAQEFEEKAEELVAAPGAFATLPRGRPFH
jgi:hypothetical protein